jgi:hypothetical protein
MLSSSADGSRRDELLPYEHNVAEQLHFNRKDNVMAVAAHPASYPHQQRRTSIDTTLEDDTSQIPVMMPATTDNGKRGYDDNRLKDELSKLVHSHDNLSLARKLSSNH